MNIKDLYEFITTTSDEVAINEVLQDVHPFDLADVYQRLDEDKQAKILSILPEETIAEMLSYLEKDEINEVIENISPETIASIVDEMEPDDAQDFMDNIDEEDASSIKTYLSDDTIEYINLLDKYEENTAGALMNPNFIKVLSGSSLKEAIKVVTLMAPNVENIYSIFVVDTHDTLLGVVELKSLIKARMPLTIDDIMLENFAYANTFDTYDTISSLVNNYDTMALPVLENGIIKGIITMDDAFDALTETAEEDYAKFAGLTEDEVDNESIRGSVKKRIPWLAILLIADVFIALVISRFDKVIEKVTILTFFQAAVLGLSGNCGTQSLAVTVRKISLGKLDDNKNVIKELLRVLLQGILMGIVLGVISFIFVSLLLLINKTEIEFFKIASVVSFAILLSVTLSNFVGSLMPCIFYKLKVDPAVASGPFITTINDLISVITYFGIAFIILSHYL